MFQAESLQSEMNRVNSGAMSGRRDTGCTEDSTPTLALAMGSRDQLELEKQGSWWGVLRNQERDEETNCKESP